MTRRPDATRTFARPTVATDPGGKIGIFFDGTLNDRDSRTRESGQAWSVPRLVDQYDGRYHSYFRGVGTEIPPVLHQAVAFAALTGLGTRQRVEEAYERIVRVWNDPLTSAEDRPIDIFGFSRGAAAAPELANLIRTRGIPDLSRRLGTIYIPIPTARRLSQRPRKPHPLGLQGRGYPTPHP